MSHTDVSAESVRPTVSHPPTDVRLHGPWLILARVAWIVLVFVVVGLFVATLPIYFMQLQTPCLTTSCPFGQLAPGPAKVLAAVGLSLTDFAFFSVTLTSISILVSLAIAVLLLWRKPNHWMAVLVAFWLVLLGAGGAGDSVETLSPLLGSVLANIVYNFFNVLEGVGTILIFCLFPNGRFVPRWTRWLVVVLLVVLALGFIFPLSSSMLFPLSGVLWFSFLITVVLAQLYRYRRVSTPMERQQTKWVVFSFAVGCIVIFGLFLPQTIFPSLRSGSLYDIVANVVPSFCFTLLVSLSFGIAILRYRLYDIDFLIRRTLIYGTLTVLLALVYLSLIFLLQSLLRGLISETGDIAIVVSTLAIAALFQPLRRRVQNVIDRRFYRRKYNAARILAAFGATLRNEVELSQLREQLVAVVEETMQPTFVSLWLRPPEHDEKQRAPWRATPPGSSEG